MIALKQHPLSAAFPAMSDADHAALTEDIKQNGQREPIIVLEGMALDGWHRYLACADLGIEPVASHFPESDDPVAFVLSKNLHRRHLTASQRAVAVVECQKWRPRGGSQSAPGADSASQMASTAHVSTRTIEQAKQAVEAGKAQAVKSGKISLKAATKPKPAKSRTEPPQDEPEGPSLDEVAKELSDAHNRIVEQDALIASLSKTDAAKEIAVWKGKFDALKGRNNQLISTQNELNKSLKYATETLSKVKKLLKVEKNSEILDAIRALMIP